jgi:hypothetical protein
MAADARNRADGRPQSDPRGGLVPAAERKLLSPAQAALAIERLHSLCLSPGNQTDELDQLTDSLRQSGYLQEITQALFETVSSPNANPHVGTLWMRRIVSSKSWNRVYPAELDALCDRGEIGRGAVLELLAYAAQKGRWNLIKPALKRHGRWLRKDPTGWPLMARALVSAGAYRAALRWTSGWEERPETDLQVRYSVAEALRGLGREKEAHTIVSAALQNPEAASQFPAMALWFCFEAALQGETDAAKAEFDKLVPAGWDEDTFCLYYLARGVMRVDQATPDRRRAAFRSAYDRIRDRFRRLPAHRRRWTMRRAFRRGVAHMARSSGKWSQAILAPWRAADSWLTLWVLLIVPGLQVFAPLYAYRCGTKRQAQSR